MTTADPSSSNEDLGSENSTPTSQPSTPETSSPRPPTLQQAGSSAGPTIMTSSSAPLGPVNAARRPGPGPARASGFTSDMQAKLKAFSLSRQGAPPAGQNPRPNLTNTQQNPGSGGPANASAGGPAVGTPVSGGGAFPGGLRLPPGMQKPNGAPTTANSPRMMSPRPGIGGGGGLAAKRGLKPGGMNLANAHKPPSADDKPAAQADTGGSQFQKFANIVDTQKGVLNFKDKAVVHGSGIDFSSGSTFSISLDEVDTMDELGKGNYGTVFKVRHARPKMRRPGQGLRGNMNRQLQASESNSNNSSSSTSGLVMAMKEIRLELDDAKFAQIIMELDILHRCVSPFIIDFYGAFFQEGSVYICIEYMDGGSIDKIYGDGVPEGVLKKITISTVMGLQYLKDQHNIIHRDVKPTNVLVNSRGQVKICDFGVSGNLVASIARTNIGCQSYMAPERISGGGMAQAGATSGGGTYSVQSDIWSLGLSIIECALGRYPYPPETYDNIFSQLSAIVDGEPPDLPADRYSEVARDFVRGCLNKIPKMRPTYAALLRHAWLAPLMKIPTIAEDEEVEKQVGSGDDEALYIGPHPETADKEVADWVKHAMERKRAGKMGVSAKPALHAAPLDAVPGSPLMTQNDSEPSDQIDTITPNPGVRIDSPELVHAKVQSLDFAANATHDSST